MAVVAGDDRRAQVAELRGLRLLVGADAADDHRVALAQRRQIGRRVQDVDVAAQRPGDERGAGGRVVLAGRLDRRPREQRPGQQVGPGVEHDAAAAIGQALDRVHRRRQVDRVGHQCAPRLDEHAPLEAGAADGAGDGARVGRLLRGGREAAADVDDRHAHAHGEAGEHLRGRGEALGWLRPLDDEGAGQPRDLGHRAVEAGRHEMHGERLDAQPERGGMARRHRDLGHWDAEVARAVADARQAHAHAHAGDAGRGEPPHLGQRVDDDERPVGGGALEQRRRLRRALDDDRAPVGLGDRARHGVLGLARDLVADPLLGQRAQDGRQAVGLVRVGQLDVGPLGAPRPGEGPLAIAHDVEVRQPQRRSVLRQQVRDAHR